MAQPGTDKSSEPPRRATATWAFRRAVGVVVLAVVGGLALGRPDVVVMAAPFAVYAALAWGRAAAPRLRAAMELGTDRTFEAETVTARVDLRSDIDLDAVTFSVGLPYGIEPVDPRTQVVAVRAGVPRELEIRVQAERWGRWKVGPTRVTTYGPHLGSTSSPLDLAVADLAVIGSREGFRAAELMPQALATAGSHRSRRVGDGLEFHAVREFAYGDRLRRINWPVSSRLGSLHVNATVTDRMADVVILVDSSYDAGRSVGVFGQASSLDVTVRAAGAIAVHYLDSGDMVSLVEFGERIRHAHDLLGRSGVTRALDWLLGVRAGTVGWEVQARRIGPQLLPARALAVVLTPLLDQRCVELLADLRQRGQAIVVVDTLPDGCLPRPGRFAEEIAQRIWVMERERTVALLGEAGVPVVGWAGSGSIDAVLRDVVRMSRGPRGVVRR
ncbi:MAG: DUF58 domain-containing protein [Streptosporangiales bacterium]